MNFIKVLLRKFFVLCLVAISLTMFLSCDNKKADITITFDNMPIPASAPKNDIKMNFDELEIPYEKIEHKVEEYFQVLEHAQKNPTDPENISKITQVKRDMTGIIMENISLFHLRNNGLPIDISID